MELYILDNQLRREVVVDRFESLIWKEKFNSLGEFKLDLDSTPVTRNLFRYGDHLALNLSNRVMVVENIEKTNSSDGRSLINISGRSLESILEQRVVYNPDAIDISKHTPDPPVTPEAPVITFNTPLTLTGTAGSVIRQIFDRVCISNELVPEDNLPFYDVGNFYPVDTLPEPDEALVIEIGMGTAYSAIENIAQSYDLGFRLVRHPVTSLLYFNVYAGNDRTSTQSELSAVVFSPDLDNLTESSEFGSIESYNNVAYVLNKKNGLQKVYADGIDPTISGFDRRILYVDATTLDLELTDPNYLAVVNQVGREALVKSRPVALMDGEIPQATIYKYEVEYGLGDLIEIRNEDGITNRMRVTEQIFVEDSEGERSYPTLELEYMVMPGSWNDWSFNTIWDSASGTWDDL